MYEYKKKKIILDFLSNNKTFSNGESYNYYKDLIIALEKTNIPKKQYPMLVTYLYAIGYIKIFEQHKEILNGNEQIKISNLGRLYVNSRKNILSKFYFWLQQDKGWGNMKWFAGMLIGFFIGWALHWIAH